MKSFGALVAHRRRELGTMQTELGARIKGRSGKPLSQKQITIWSTIVFACALPVLKQLALTEAGHRHALLLGSAPPASVRATTGV